MKNIIILVGILMGIASTHVFAHSGGTDKDGGHYDSRTGGYHKHP